MGNSVSWLKTRHSRLLVSRSPVNLSVATWNTETNPSILFRKIDDASRLISSYLRWLVKEKGSKKLPNQELHELFCPLKDIEEKEVFHALHGEGDGILVVHEPSNIEISTQVIKCLSPGEWLNDEVINLYLELLKERERRDPTRFLKCHFFNTFFYKKVANGKTGYDFKSVRRWTSHRKLGYYLIDCDKIFIPIHRGNHWCLAVVDIMKKAFHYLDSFGGMDTDVLNILARYLSDEIKDKNGREIDIMSWKQKSIKNLPRQKNGSDCGMFMLKYCDFYSRGLSLCFGQEHMEYFRKRTVKEILNLRAE